MTDLKPRTANKRKDGSEREGGAAQKAAHKNSCTPQRKEQPQGRGKKSDKAEIKEKEKKIGLGNAQSNAELSLRFRPERTDMAADFFKSDACDISGNVKKTEVVVDEALGARLNREAGRYITVESCLTTTCSRAEYKPLIEEIANCIKSLVCGCRTFLAVGVGNPLLTADALGSRAVSLLKVNRGFSGPLQPSELSAFSPNVSGVTGIESYELVKSVSALVKPDCVILIDSLASAAVSRLGTAFQICDCGLVPGSGVANGKQPLNAKTLKVKKAVSIGVPLVVYAETIIREATGEELSLQASSGLRELLVTPKDIDVLMGECAHIIAESINQALEL